MTMPSPKVTQDYCQLYSLCHAPCGTLHVHQEEGPSSFTEVLSLISHGVGTGCPQTVSFGIIVGCCQLYLVTNNKTFIQKLIFFKKSCDY